MERRLSRYQHFKEFYEKATSIFNDYEKKDAHSHEFSRLYSFYVAPGGRNGGHDKRLIQIFFGQRPFDAIDELVVPPASGLPSLSSRILTEGGACLNYQCEDSGHVTCFLFPARTERMRREEDAILLDVIKDPSTLLKERTTHSHWKSFISYMHVTSLDGEPTLIDRMRVFYILYTRGLSVKGEGVSPRIWTHLGSVIKFSLTVGLSGFLVAIMLFFAGSGKVFITGQAAELYAPTAAILKHISDLQATVTLIKQEIVNLEGHFDCPLSVKVMSPPEKPKEKGKRGRQLAPIPATSAKDKKPQ